VRSLRLTPQTKFHIDFTWWEKQNKDIRVFMRDLLCPESRAAVEASPPDQLIDVVDSETAEVSQLDPVWEAIRACCSQRPDYITADSPLLDSIFRTFLANGNKPLSVLELHQRLDRKPPEIILRLLTKGQVYMGIRPV
jgi:hypothetical protein